MTDPWSIADPTVTGSGATNVRDLPPASDALQSWICPMLHAAHGIGQRALLISYNGEVYNAEDIRKELSPFDMSYRGHSDTEVILEAWCRWGPKKTLEKLIGMFVMCVWDREEQRMWLVRDRLGIKPLYWGKFGDLLLFGSELKTLRAHPDWKSSRL